MSATMSATLLRILRFVLVVLGITVILYAINWRSIVRVPAGEPGPTGEVAEIARDFPAIHPPRDTPEDPGWMTAVIALGPASDAAELEMNFPQEWYRPGILETFAQATVGLLFLGLIPLIGVYPLQAARWWILMRCRGLAVSWWRTLRLVFVGAFCNFCLPGTEGGDVVKAWYVARGSDRRVVAVMSVIFDRLTGVLGLIALAAVAGIFATSDDTAQSIGWWSLVAMIFMVTLTWLYFSAGLRSWLRLDRIQGLFGGNLLARVEESIHAYGQHKGSVIAAIGMSVLVQTLLAVSATVAGIALGIQHEPLVIMAIMPILFLAAAVPMSWQGVGVMEGLGVLLLAVPGLASPNEVIGMLIVYRGYELCWSLIGSVFLVRGDIHLHPERHGGQLT